MESAQLMNYHRLLHIPGSQNYFVLPWGQVLIRNFDRGNLVTYKSYKEYKRRKIPIWVLCELNIFQDQNDEMFPVFNCDCGSMRGVANLRMKQDRLTLERMKCQHSQLCSKIVSDMNIDWRVIWPIVLPQASQIHWSIDCNRDVKYVTLINDASFLGCVLGKPSITSTLKVLVSC